MKNCKKYLHLLFFVPLVVLAVLAGCNKKKDSPAVKDTTLAITSFAPPEAAKGSTVVITGKNISADKAANTVKFNGTLAVVTEAKEKELSVTVPEGATNGRITVIVGEQTVSSATDFKVNVTAPSISAFNPAKGDIDTEVTITGNRFVDNSKVYFGRVEATAVTFESKTTLKVKVPAGALNGKIKVVSDNLEAV